MLSVFPVTKIKSRSGVSLYPNSSSQRGVEAGGNNNNDGRGSNGRQPACLPACCQRSAQAGSGGCGRACAKHPLLRNEDRLMTQWAQ